MKLTMEQEKQVSENHNLIYWYGNMRHLDMEEWYGLLAIELCEAVMRHDETKSTISTFFKLRCDNLVAKEWTKSQRQKNAHNGHIELQDHKHQATEDDVAVLMDLDELFDGPFGEMLRLKADGFTQAEIAEVTGVTQSYVSKIINGIKEEYYANN